MGLIVAGCITGEIATILSQFRLEFIFEFRSVMIASHGYIPINLKGMLEEKIVKITV